MIVFKETLKQQALSILSAHSTDDELKAARDIGQIERMLDSLQHNLIDLQTLHMASDLDNRLRYDYPIITRLQNIANQMNSCSPNRANSIPNASDDLAYRLLMDERGIWAITLIKHRIVEEIKDVFDDIP